LMGILTEAFVAASDEYGIRAAQEWGHDYTFPPHLLQRDLQDFQSAGGDMRRLCQSRQESLEHERISLSRITDCFA
jgi:hypothetical protein